MKKEIIGEPLVIGGKAVPISQAVRAGDLLFVAGQLGVDNKFEVFSDDIDSFRDYSKCWIARPVCALA